MTQNSRRGAGVGILFTTLLVCLRILTQCHADDPSHPHYVITHPSIPKTRELKPCDLATTDEVKAALGASAAVTDLIAEPHLYNNCNYYDASRTRVLVVSGLSAPVERRAIPSAVPVTGVGDLALYEFNPYGSKLWVNYGSASFAVSLAYVDTRDGPLIEGRLIALAHGIVTRL